MSLSGRRILVTRSRQQASELAAHLTASGAIPILIPTIEIAPPVSYAPLDEAIAQLAVFDWIVFTSANAVHTFRDRTDSRKTPKLAAIGPSTARAATSAGFEIALVPPQAVAESLIETLLPHIDPGTRVLLIRAAVARDELPDALTKAGAVVTIVEAYRTIIPKESVALLRDLFAAPERYPDAVTFTSSSTANNLVALLEAARLTLPAGIVRVSIGPVTSQTLRNLNLPPTLEAPEATVASIVAALVDYFTDF